MINRNFIILMCVISLDSICYGLLNAWGTEVVGSFLRADNLNSLDTSSSYILPFGSTLLFILSPLCLFLNPVFGLLSDLWGRRKVLIWSYGATCTVFIFMLLAVLLENKILIIIGLTMFSVNTANVPLVQASLLDISHTRKTTNYSMAILFAILFIEVGFVIQGVNAIAGGQMSKLHFSIGIIVIGLIIETFNYLLIQFKLKETYRPKLVKGKLSDSRYLASIVNRTFTLLTNVRLHLLLLFLFFAYLAWGFLDQSISNYLVMKQYFSDHEAHQLLLMRTIVMLLALVFLYPLLIKRWSEVKTIQICLFLITIGIFGYIVLPYHSALWFFSLLISIGLALMFPLTWSMLKEMLQPRYYGLVMGIANFIWLLGWTVSGSVCTAIASYPDWALIIALGCFVFAIIVFAKLNRQGSLAIVVPKVR